MKRLIIAVHDGTDRLACAHIAESDEEADEVVLVAVTYGPVSTFKLNDDDPLQYWDTP